VLGTELSLTLYYAGLGFVVFLLWATVAGEPGRTTAPARRGRLHRLAIGMAVAGLLHPGLAIAARDLAVQLGRTEGVHDPRVPATMRLTTAALCISMAVSAALISMVIAA
jgi:hypothetical protein